MEAKEILQYILPEEVLEYFDVTRVTTDEKGKLVIYLDEKNQLPKGLPEGQYESKGFTAAMKIQDFPVRERAVFLRIRRRKWLNKQTGKVYNSPWNLATEGTKYTKEFGAFLKELVRQ